RLSHPTVTAPTPTHTLSLHAALPILHVPGILCRHAVFPVGGIRHRQGAPMLVDRAALRGLPHLAAAGGLRRFPAVIGGKIIADQDRKSTRLNSSHVSISYAVFCLKKK